MIALDTNVLSELLRSRPEPRVVDWLHERARSQLFTTVVSRGEMLSGVHGLPDGQRKQHLQQAVLAIFAVTMAKRVLPYDGDAADAHAAIAAARRLHGHPISLADTMIAGIAHSRGAVLATRNVRDFEGCGIGLIDPWQQEPVHALSRFNVAWCIRARGASTNLGRFSARPRW